MTSTENSVTETWLEADARRIRLDIQLDAFMTGKLICGHDMRETIGMVGEMVRKGDFTVDPDAPETTREIDLLVRATTSSDDERRVVYTRLLREISNMELNIAMIALVRGRTKKP